MDYDPIEGGLVGDASIDAVDKKTARSLSRAAQPVDEGLYDQEGLDYAQMAHPQIATDNEIEFLSYFVTPDSLDVTGINRDVVLANIPSSEVPKVKSLYEGLYMLENLEKSSKIKLPGIKHFLLSMIAAYMNLSRGVNGLTAKLARTQRVETVTASWTAKDLARVKKEQSSSGIFTGMRRMFRF